MQCLTDITRSETCFSQKPKDGIGQQHTNDCYGKPLIFLHFTVNRNDDHSNRGYLYVTYMTNLSSPTIKINYYEVCSNIPPKKKKKNLNNA